MTESAGKEFTLSVFLTTLAVGIISGTQVIARNHTDLPPALSEFVLSWKFQTSVLFLLIFAALISASQTTWYVRYGVLAKAILTSVAVIVLTVSVLDSRISSFKLWAGFGARPALTLVVFVICAMVLGQFQSLVAYETFKLQRLKVPLLGGLFAMCIPSILQHQNGLSNLGDTTYHVLDELLAPSLGAYPYANYTPQYGAVLGLILAPIRFIPFSGSQKMTLVIVVCNIFILLIPVLITEILKLVHPNFSRLTVFVTFVLLYVASGSDNTNLLTREFSHFSRYLPPLFALWILIRAIRLETSLRKNRWSWAAGMSLGFVVINGLSFGLTFSGICLFWLISMTLVGHIEREVVKRIVLGLSSAVLMYIVVIRIGIGQFSFSSYLGLSTDALILYNFVPMYWIGAHLIVMSLVVWALSLGLQNFRLQPRIWSNEELSIQLTAGVMGSWLLLLLIKYLQAPIRENVHMYLVPTFIIGALLVAKYLPEFHISDSLHKKLLLTPVFFIALLPLAAVWQTPSPIDEIRRLTGKYAGSTDWSSTPGRPSDGWSPSALSIYDDFVETSNVLSETLGIDGSTVGYFGFMGHTVELLTGINNYLGIPAPESMRFGKNQELLACAPLRNSSPDYLIVYLSNFPCAGYKRNETLSEEKFDIFERVAPSKP